MTKLKINIFFIKRIKTKIKKIKRIRTKIKKIKNKNDNHVLFWIEDRNEGKEKETMSTNHLSSTIIMRKTTCGTFKDTIEE